MKPLGLHVQDYWPYGVGSDSSCATRSNCFGNLLALLKRMELLV